ncbi:hypothetical protein [Polaromonas naphthalenivorans]|uniref:Uncharacterized protein n=1 Tax=Polaromonas naphthalenivorans (strain CJ2) TaxID=365044 RepID=A1VRW3_POLNA|nr:hypothetical protein [Polaromonas naphthalenivorans]ABM38391.1 hypothetical protein Pnap_3092 [Polaromonas naphthalenivorans CJ2]
MTTSHASHAEVEAVQRRSLSNERVSSDFMALASHMMHCQRSRGRFFTVRVTLETLHAITAPRLVTTGAALVACSLGLLGLGLLTMA